MLEQQRTPPSAEPVQGFLDGTEALTAAAEPAAPQSEALVSQSPLPESPPTPWRKRGLPGAYRDPFICVTSLAVFCAYLAISLFRLLQLNPTSWDLAIYTEYVKQAASWHAPVADVRTAGFNLLGDHFQPIVMMIAPLFRVFPSAATLVAVQALLAALSVFAVSQAARAKFGRFGVGPSRAIAVAYGFSWGLQQLANFDFHEVAFAVPLLAFSLSALVRGRIKAAVWWALPLVFVKEDQGFTVAAIGLYLAIAGMRAAGREQAAAAPAPGAAAPEPAAPGAPEPAARRRCRHVRGSRRQAAHQGGPGPLDLGFCLVVPGHRGDHPALQPGPSVRLLERRRDPRLWRAPDRGRPDQPVLPRLA